MDGVTGLIDVWDEFAIVALGEMHGVEQGGNHIEALARHPRLAERPTAVVVEYGNARYQALCDAYVVDGADVPMRDLQRAWFDFAGGGPWGFRAPIYPRFFATVREVNKQLPPERRIRVRLGDPPIDWSQIHTQEEIRAAISDRDVHFASAVVEEMQQGKRVLAYIGTYHLMRRYPVPPWVTEKALDVIEILERDLPGKAFVVHPHCDLSDDRKDEIEGKLAEGPVPSLTRLADSWLGALPAEAFFSWKLTGIDGKQYSPFAQSTLLLRDLVDGFLYLGPLSTYTQSPFDYGPVDDEDRAELRRRIAIWGDEELGPRAGSSLTSLTG